MEKPKTKRKTRYWNAYAVVMSDNNGDPMSVESFRKRDLAYGRYARLLRKFPDCSSDMVMDGLTVCGVRDPNSGCSLRVVTNKVWKEGFEK